MQIDNPVFIKTKDKHTAELLKGDGHQLLNEKNGTYVFVLNDTSHFNFTSNDYQITHTLSFT